MKLETSAGLLLICTLVLSASAWFTHIFYCFAHDAWGFLVAGALFFPIGIVHGFWLWL